MSNQCKCGAYILPSAKFCHHCGEPVAASENPSLHEFPSDAGINPPPFGGSPESTTPPSVPPPIPPSTPIGNDFPKAPVASSPFPEILQFKANLNEGMLSTGGNLVITPTQLIFRPHAINVGNRNHRVYEISEIVGYKKGMLTFMDILFRNGLTIKLTVWNKQKIIDELEARRKYLG